MRYSYLARITTLLLATIAAVHAGPINVVNWSFESDVLALGDSLSTRLPSGVGFLDGWVTSDPTGDSSGPMHPYTLATPAPAGTDTSGFGYTYQFFAVPDGVNVAYTNGAPFYQIVQSPIQANTTYTLQAYTGNRYDYGSTLPPVFSENQGFFMELAVDIDGNYFDRVVLARTSWERNPDPFFQSHYGSVNAPDATLPNRGTWGLLTLTSTFGGSDALLGKNLMISFGAPGQQANFDAVTLNATSNVPEPGSIGLLLSGLVLVGLKIRRTSL